MIKQKKKISYLGFMVLVIITLWMIGLNKVKAENIPTYNINSTAVTISSTGSYIIEGNGTATKNKIVISSNIGEVNITLNNVNIDVSGDHDGRAFLIGSGTKVNLTLRNSNNLRSSLWGAGLTVENGGTLIITEDSGDASLNATGGTYGAGIGGGTIYFNGGTIIIKGGRITAKGGRGGAGIGAGVNTSGGSVTIQGGIVNATGYNGAGIGGGGVGVYGDGTCGGSGGSILIEGGNVSATGGGSSAGIGGGVGGSGGNITITGGTVNANGSDYAAGIGSGGVYNSGSKPNCGTINISGGTITANGGISGPGIGVGQGGSGGSISITGSSNITATSNSEGAGIGGGYNTNCSTITIGENCTVNANSREGAGIGGGKNCNGGSITINGGSITAKSSYGGAGIGGGSGGYGGSGGNGGFITINGGSIKASSTYGGAGIGGGKGGNGGTIKIEGGMVNAFGGTDSEESGAGIGGGVNGGGGNITINGGTVTARGGKYYDFSSGNFDQIEYYGIGDGSNGNGGNTIISGGSVNATITGTPTNDGIQPIYQSIITLNVPTVLKSSEITYAMNGGPNKCSVKTDENGKLYLWMNTGLQTVKIWDATNTYYAGAKINSSNIESEPFLLKVADGSEEAYYNSWTLAQSAVAVNGTITLLGDVTISEDSVFPSVPCTVDGGPSSYKLIVGGNMNYPSKEVMLKNLTLCIDGTLSVEDSYLALEGGKLTGQGTIIFKSKNSNVTGYPGMLVLSNNAQIDSNTSLTLQTESTTQAEDVIVTNTSNDTALVNINKLTLGSGFRSFILGGAKGTYNDGTDTKNCYHYTLKKSVRTISMEDYTTSYTGNDLAYGLSPIITPNPEIGENVFYTYFATKEDRANNENAVIPMYPGTYYVRARMDESDCCNSAYADACMTVTKAAAAVPAKPTASNIGTTEITLTEISNAKYKMEEGDWQDSNIFSGLIPGNAYTFYIMTEETETSFASDPSSAVIYTRPSAPLASQALIDFQNEKIFFDVVYEMNTSELFDGTNIPSLMVIGDYQGQTLYLRQKAVEGSTPESDVIPVAIPARSTAPDINMVDLSYDDSDIEGNSIVAVIQASGDKGELQYRLDNGEWQDSNIFKGLAVNTDYTFSVSYKPTESEFRSNTASLTKAYSVAGISSVSASNGEVRITLDRIPTESVTESDFEAIISVEGEAQSKLVLTDFNWEEVNRTATFRFNPIEKKSVSQNAVVYASYHGKPAVDASAFMIDQIRPDGVTLDRKTLIMPVSGPAITLHATVTPKDAGDKEVTWVSDNLNVISVENGTITPIATGSAIVIARTNDGGYEALCNVMVVEDSQLANIISATAVNGTISILLDKIPALIPDLGNIKSYIGIDGSTEENLSLNNLHWDEASRTITVDFEPLAPKEEDQEVRIIVSYNGDSTVSTDFSIPGTVIKVTGVSLDKGTLNLIAGGTVGNLKAYIFPDNATNQSVIWKSSNTLVATVTDGLITPLSTGTVTITVTTVDGSFIADCIVKVYSKTSTPDTPISKPVPHMEDEGSRDVIEVDMVADKTEESGSNNNIPVPMETFREKLSDTSVNQIEIQVRKATGSLVLGAEVLQEVKESGKSLTVTVEGKEEQDTYSWTFDANQLISQKELSELNLTIERSNINEIPELEELLGSSIENGIVFEFSHEGLLPAQASVRIYVGDQKGFTEGKKIFLYHINKDTGKLESLPFSSDYVIDENGFVTIDIVHCSDYVALLEKPEEIVSLKNQIQVSPVTKTLYIKNKKHNFANIVIKLPNTLEFVKSLQDSTSQTAVGGVTVSYTSSDKKVVKVNREGKVTAVGAGKAIITTTIKLYNGTSKIIKTTIIVK